MTWEDKIKKAELAVGAVFAMQEQYNLRLGVSSALVVPKYVIVGLVEQELGVPQKQAIKLVDAVVARDKYDFNGHEFRPKVKRND